MQLCGMHGTRNVNVDISNQDRVAHGDFHECLDIGADERDGRSVVTCGIEKAMVRYMPQNSRRIEGRAAPSNASELNEQTELRWP